MNNKYQSVQKLKVKYDIREYRLNRLDKDERVVEILKRKMCSLTHIFGCKQTHAVEWNEMSSDDKKPIDVDKDETTSGVTVRFDDTVYVDGNAPPIVRFNENPNFNSANGNRLERDRQRSGILKRRENTITTADAPPIILSDEGLKAGRVSPFLNFPLFLSMTIRSVGIIFGDM